MFKKLDHIGISLSFLCLVHCVVLPMVPISLPILARYYLTHPYLHVVLAIVVFPVALIALWRGFRCHQRTSIFIFGLIGVILILLASTTWVALEFIRPYETILTITGSAILVTSHTLNLMQMKICQIPDFKSRS